MEISWSKFHKAEKYWQVINGHYKPRPSKDGYINSLLFYHIGCCYLGLTNSLAMEVENLSAKPDSNSAMIKDPELSLLTSRQIKLMHER